MALIPSIIEPYASNLAIAVNDGTFYIDNKKDTMYGLKMNQVRQWVYGWGAAIALLGSSISAPAQALSPITGLPQPRSGLLAQSANALYDQVQRCMQQAVDRQGGQTGNIQTISSRCMMSILILDGEGAVRPDASDRLGKVLQFSGVKITAPVAQGEGSVDLKKIPQGSLYTLPVTLNGQTYPFLLDTGASTTILSAATSQRLKLKSEPISSDFMGYFVVGNQPTGQRNRIFTLPTLQVGGATVSQLKTMSTSTLPYNAAGILGLDVLSRFDVTLNPETRKLTLSRPAAARSDSIPLKGQFGVMTAASVFIDGKGPFRFLIDTGAGRTTLSKALAQRVGLSVYDAGNIRVMGLGGLERVQLTRLKTLKIQTHHLTSLDALVMNSQVFQTLGIDGIIGQDILNRYVQTWQFGPPGPLGAPEVGRLLLQPLLPLDSPKPETAQ